jgi:hypothetical protein
VQKKVKMIGTSLNFIGTYIPKEMMIGELNKIDF